MTAHDPVSRRAVRFAVLALAALGFAAVVYTVATTTPTRDSLYPKCATYYVTRLHCPGCGTGRAAHLLLNGHVLGALRCNAFAPFFLPFLVVAAFRYLGYWALGVAPPKRRPARALWLWLLAVALILYSVARNIPAEPFNYLAPQEFGAVPGS